MLTWKDHHSEAKWQFWVAVTCLSLRHVKKALIFQLQRVELLTAFWRAGTWGVNGRKNMALTSSGQTYGPYFCWSWVAHSPVGSKSPFIGRQREGILGSVRNNRFTQKGRTGLLVGLCRRHSWSTSSWARALLQPELQASLLLLWKRLTWDYHTIAHKAFAHAWIIQRQWMSTDAKAPGTYQEAVNLVLLWLLGKD